MGPVTRLTGTSQELDFGEGFPGQDLDSVHELFEDEVELPRVESTEAPVNVQRRTRGRPRGSRSTRNLDGVPSRQRAGQRNQDPRGNQGDVFNPELGGPAWNSGGRSHPHSMYSFAPIGFGGCGDKPAVVLTGNNYLRWKREMLISLRAQGLEGHVDPAYVNRFQRQPGWGRADARAQALILRSLDDVHEERVRCHDTSIGI